MNKYTIPVDIASWLSELDECSSPPYTPSKSSHSIRRERNTSEDNKIKIGSDRKHLRLHADPFLDPGVFVNTDSDFIYTPRRSPQKKGEDTMPPSRPITPDNSVAASSKGKYAHSSQPTLSSSSSAPKQTRNNDNIRASLATQMMYFEDEEAYDRYSGLQEEVNKIVFGERGSAMRPESLRQIKQWRIENATKDEATYFNGLMPQVIKDTRSQETSKRSFEGEIVSQAKTFDSDGLDKKRDPLFVKNILPQRLEMVEKKLGLTTPKPDFAFGLKRPRFPDPHAPTLPNEVDALIGVAPGLQHPFFVIENKGCEDSIETAENQAIRSGATLVAARRLLNQKARPAGEQEIGGADIDSFAFSCSWVPQMANIHLHWYELREDGLGVYHMSLLRGYLMSNKGDITDFRRDIHNILDWGVSTKRRKALEELVRKIAGLGAPANPP